MKTKHIRYEELRRREHNLNRLEKQGVKLLYSKKRFKVVCGVGCLVVAIFPNGLGLIFYPLGFYLLKINKVDIYKHKENLLRKIKVFILLKGGFRKWNI